jgi:hypothetical protein
VRGYNNIWLVEDKESDYLEAVTRLSDANNQVKIRCDRNLNEAELVVLISTVFVDMVSVFLVVLILTIKRDMNSRVFVARMK